MRIIGCDLHARQQTLAMLDTETGEVVKMTLTHEGDNVQEFYSALPRPACVGWRPGADFLKHDWFASVPAVCHFYSPLITPLTAAFSSATILVAFSSWLGRMNGRAICALWLTTLAKMVSPPEIKRRARAFTDRI